MTTGFHSGNEPMRTLTADEIDAAAGALRLNLVVVQFDVSLTKDGISGAVKVGDGPWHGGTIWFN
jgi:hypothetical protein